MYTSVAYFLAQEFKMSVSPKEDGYESCDDDEASVPTHASSGPIHHATVPHTSVEPDSCRIAEHAGDNGYESDVIIYDEADLGYESEDAAPSISAGDIPPPQKRKRGRPPRALPDEEQVLEVEALPPPLLVLVLRLQSRLFRW